jgi:hypothetical protein
VVELGFFIFDNSLVFFVLVSLHRFWRGGLGFGACVSQSLLADGLLVVVKVELGKVVVSIGLRSMLQSQFCESKK